MATNNFTTTCQSCGGVADAWDEIWGGGGIQCRRCGFGIMAIEYQEGTAEVNRKREEEAENGGAKLPPIKRLPAKSLKNLKAYISRLKGLLDAAMDDLRAEKLRRR